jgi:3-methyladenine DNA glycosylase AlkC
MAEPLKNLYNPAFFESIIPTLKRSLPGFSETDFVFKVFDDKWPELELKQRVRQISVALAKFLPADFRLAAEALIGLARDFQNAGAPQQSFHLIFIADYIEVYGLEHPKESFQAMEAVTQLVSCEFAIRPFLQAYPDQAWNVLQSWSRHSNENVRRLASEGCRPRLPWGKGVPQLKENPHPVIRILENLKEDPSEYVRRSVANNLNDISKDHPELVLELAKRWIGKNSRTDWILKHGCRSLLRKGNAAAFQLHGIKSDLKCKVYSFALSQSPLRIGETLGFKVGFKNLEATARKFRLDYQIQYQTTSGRPSTKVFRLREFHFQPGEKTIIESKKSFKDFTTRKHYKGKHVISILVNGKSHMSREFFLV